MNEGTTKTRPAASPAAAAVTAKVPVTVLVAVKNEARNIEKCLRRLAPAERVVVLDSQSTDATADLARSLGAEVVQFHYAGGYPKKRQWAFEQVPIETPWTLLIDADEEVTDALWEGIRNTAVPEAPHDGYFIRKQFHFLGRPFRFGGFSFEAILLFRTGRGRFEHLVDEPKDAMDMEVHERLEVQGSLGRIAASLVHNDFKGLEAYIDRHNKYSTWEARTRVQSARSGRYGRQTGVKARLFGNPQERRRFLKRVALRLPLEPLAWFLYHYVLHLGFLEGWRGWVACRLKAQYIFQVRVKMREMELSDREP